MTSKRVVAVDLGATSGRVMVSRVGVEPDVLELTEVHRFPNGARRADDGSLRWDLERIRREVTIGIRTAAQGGPVEGIGIDAWAVDYGLLDADHRLLEAPYSHRDSRTGGVLEKVVAEIGESELYDVTGLQQLPFNTLYQLVAARDSTGLTTARTLLLLPDLLGYWLTGEVGAERTNASTTQLYGAVSHEWAEDLVDRVGLPTDILPPLRDAGSLVGTLLPEVARDLGVAGDVPVIAVGSHDTASAVVGVPAAAEPFGYVSSGTWSLVGLELPEPMLTEQARIAGFTNEGGVDGTIRFLKNVMGLWVLSECQRAWDLELADLLADAAQVPVLTTLIDIDDVRLLPPGAETDTMPVRVAALAAEAGEPVPSTPGEVARCVLDSLALACRRTVRDAARIADVGLSVLHVVGGGSQNAMLCQLTADACGLPVLAGPKEAAALGNVLGQARTLGVQLPGLADMRALLRRTQALRRFEPQSDVDWGAAESRLPARGR